MSRLFISVLLLSILPVSAVAQLPAQRWIQAGDWSVYAGSGCVAVTADMRDRASLTLGFDRTARRYFIVAASRDWDIEAGRSYEIGFDFAQAQSLGLSAIGENKDGNRRLVWEGEDLAPLIRNVLAEKQVSIELNGRRLASFSLDGIRTAIDRLGQCREQSIVDASRSGNASAAAKGGAPSPTAAAPSSATPSLQTGDPRRHVIADLPRSPYVDQGEAVWERFGAWDILAFSGREYCAASRYYDDGREVRVGHDRASNSYYLAIYNPAWSWIDRGRDYNANLTFVPGTSLKRTAIGGVVIQGASLLLWRLPEGAAFEAVAGAQHVVVEMDGRKIEELDLQNALEVLRATFDCIKEGVLAGASLSHGPQPTALAAIKSTAGLPARANPSGKTALPSAGASSTPRPPTTRKADPFAHKEP